MQNLRNICKPQKYLGKKKRKNHGKMSCSKESMYENVSVCFRFSSSFTHQIIIFLKKKKEKKNVLSFLSFSFLTTYNYYFFLFTFPRHKHRFLSPSPPYLALPVMPTTFLRYACRIRHSVDTSSDDASAVISVSRCLGSGGAKSANESKDCGGLLFSELTKGTLILSRSR